MPLPLPYNPNIPPMLAGGGISPYGYGQGDTGPSLPFVPGSRPPPAATPMLGGLGAMPQQTAAPGMYAPAPMGGPAAGPQRFSMLGRRDAQGQDTRSRIGDLFSGLLMGLHQGGLLGGAVGAFRGGMGRIPPQQSDY